MATTKKVFNAEQAKAEYAKVTRLEAEAQQAAAAAAKSDAAETAQATAKTKAAEAEAARATFRSHEYTANTFEERYALAEMGASNVRLTVEALPSYERIMQNSSLFRIKDGKLELDGALKGEIDAFKQKLEQHGNIKDSMESVKDTLSERGMKTSIIDRVVKNTAVRQFEVNAIARKLNRELKIQHDAIEKLVKDYEKVFKGNISTESRARLTELTSELTNASTVMDKDRIKVAQDKLAKFSRSTEGANIGLASQLEAQIDQHTTAIEDIKDLGKSIEEYGLKIELKDPAAPKSVVEKLAEAKPGMKDEMVAKAEAELPTGPNRLVEGVKIGLGLGMVYDGMTNEDRSGAMKAGEIGLGALLSGHGAWKLLSRVSQAATHAFKF